MKIMLKDSNRHKGMRNQLVSTIERKGITDKKVLQAISKIPRHLFMDSSFIDFAYQDKPFPIGADQTISQPFTVAFQTELLKVKPGDKILEIGADRILFSADWPFENIDHAAEWFDVCTISEDDRRKIGRLNSAQLFKLDLGDAV